MTPTKNILLCLMVFCAGLLSSCTISSGNSDNTATYRLRSFADLLVNASTKLPVELIKENLERINVPGHKDTLTLDTSSGIRSTILAVECLAKDTIHVSTVKRGNKSSDKGQLFLECLVTRKEGVEKRDKYTVSDIEAEYFEGERYYATIDFNGPATLYWKGTTSAQQSVYTFTLKVDALVTFYISGNEQDEVRVKNGE